MVALYFSTESDDAKLKSMFLEKSVNIVSPVSVLQLSSSSISMTGAAGLQRTPPKSCFLCFVLH